MNALLRNRHAEAWESFARSIPKPRAILALSAHWYVPGTRISARARPRTVHDFNRGFPKELFDFEYPAANSEALAARVRELLAPREVASDTTWGIDHGAWSVLAHLFPGADVPVVELSIDRTEPPAFHYELGARLGPLRDEGVLILASGNVVHNLELAERQAGAPPFDWAVRFEERVCSLLAARDHAPLIRYRHDGDDARLSIPTPDHYLPLLYAIALQRGDEPLALVTRGIEMGALSMLAFSVGR